MHTSSGEGCFIYLLSGESILAGVLMLSSFLMWEGKVNACVSDLKRLIFNDPLFLRPPRCTESELKYPWGGSLMSMDATSRQNGLLSCTERSSFHAVTTSHRAKGKLHLSICRLVRCRVESY